MNGPPSTADHGRALRWLSDTHEQAQQARIQAGDRLRGLLQAREASQPRATGERVSPDAVLAAIRRGESDGPLPAFGRVYRLHCEQEREMLRLLEECLAEHPAWEWLRHLRGLGPSLAGRLLGRLDVTRAETPSSFWAFCGLATVPGVEYRCATCGLRGSFAVDQPVSGQHVRLGGSEPCPDRMRPTGSADSAVRVAQPRPGRGEKPTYDHHAKQVCYLIGAAFLRAGGPYEQYYRSERAKLDDTRPGWTDGRKHLAALRKMEKLFLAHLWLVWREALGLPVTEPFEGRSTGPDPWEMIEQPRRRRWSRAGKPGGPRTGPKR